MWTAQEGLWTRARQNQADFSVFLWVWGDTKWTVPYRGDSQKHLGIALLALWVTDNPSELLLSVKSLICSSVFGAFWLKASQLRTPHVHLIPVVIQYPRGVWVTSGMWDCFLFPDWRVGTFTGQNTSFVIDGNKQPNQRATNTVVAELWQEYMFGLKLIFFRISMKKYEPVPWVHCRNGWMQWFVLLKEVRQGKELGPADLKAESRSHSKPSLPCLLLKNIPDPIV